MRTVGIPRALLFYQYFPLWKSFFDCLGVEVVSSQPTNRSIVAAGASKVVPDTCLPVKVFCGHCLELARQNVDYLFIPSIKSIEKQVYNCSKFVGLPDIVRATIRNGPEILDVDVDVNQGRRSLYLAVYEVGRHFTWNPIRISHACDQALATHGKYIQLMQAGQDPDESIASLWADWHMPTASQAECRSETPTNQLTVAVIGHPYNVHDGYLNHDVLRRLRDMGIRVLTGQMVPEWDVKSGVTRLAGKPYWTYEGDIVGVGGHYLTRPEVDGMISIVSFACGPDSVMLDAVQREAKRQGRTPYMSLTVDEHTGAAGFVTRVEAFVDMIRRRKYRGEPHHETGAATKGDKSCTISL
jgi:predicted nucleotide-binding protein (sugar kinase/HSP70/actin superfamily)